MKDASSVDLIKSILQAEQTYPDWKEAAQRGASVSMTYLALSLSNYVNGVAKLHGEVSRKMFPNVPIEAITNGVHAATWTSPAFQDLFDRYIASWREDNYSLRGALGLPPEEVWAAHLLAKHSLLEAVRRKTGLKLDPEAFTIGFARRATGYKRADLILRDLDRLRQIAKNVGPFQIVYAGKAHPAGRRRKRDHQEDLQGEEGAEEGGLCRIPGRLQPRAGRESHFGRRFVAEHAAVSDGGVRHERDESGGEWRAELEHFGWLVGGRLHRGDDRMVDRRTSSRRSLAGESGADNVVDAESLYSKFESVILPMFYEERNRYLEVMQHAIAINGSFFNTQRMVQQYITDAYLR